MRACIKYVSDTYIQADIPKLTIIHILYAFKRFYTFIIYFSYTRDIIFCSIELFLCQSL